MANGSPLEASLFGIFSIEHVDESSDEETVEDDYNTSGREDEGDDSHAQAPETIRGRPSGEHHLDPQPRLPGDIEVIERLQEGYSRPNRGGETSERPSCETFSRGAGASSTKDAHGAHGLSDIGSAASSSQIIAKVIAISGTSEDSSPITPKNVVTPEIEVVMHRMRHLKDNVHMGGSDSLKVDLDLSTTPKTSRTTGFHTGSGLTNMTSIRVPDSNGSGTRTTEVQQL